jgi:hypothetical protein
VTAICEGGFIPSFLQGHPRITDKGFVPAGLYEIVIEKDRQPIVDDRPKIPSEVVELAKREERAKAKEFIAAFRKSAGLDK